MGKNSNSNEKYWRAGIAMPIERRAAFEQRLQECGLETLGDLATLFTLAPGVVEALAPINAQFKASRVSVKSVADKRKEAAAKLKTMTPEQIELLLQRMSETTGE